jgi:hypothetical protein
MRIERGQRPIATRSTPMKEMKMVIVPSGTTTRIWGRNPSRTTSFRGSLPSRPINPEAWTRLLEALGSFAPVRAALVAPGRVPSCDTSLCPGWWYDVRGGNYELTLIDDRRDWLGE